MYVELEADHFPYFPRLLPLDPSTLPGFPHQLNVLQHPSTSRADVLFLQHERRGQGDEQNPTRQEAGRQASATRKRCISSRAGFQLRQAAEGWG